MSVISHLWSNFSVFNIDDQSDDDSSASVAEPDYSPDKEGVRPQYDVAEHRLQDASKMSRLSTCHDVTKWMSSPLKCPDFSDKDDTDGNMAKKPKMTSVRKKPADRNEQKCIDVSESPCQERSDSSKNLKKHKGRAQIKSKPSPDKSNERKQSTEADKTFTETKTHFFPDTVNSSSYLSSAAELGDAAFELSKESSAPFQKSKQRTPRAAKLSISSLGGSLSDSKSVASASADGEGDVFEDYFSPANSHQNSKRPFLPNLPVGRDIAVPFELGPLPKKRKQRKRESTGLETTSKKKKLKESETGQNHSQQSDARGEPESQVVKLTLDRPSTNVTLAAKRRRQSTLPFRNIGTSSDAGKPRRASTSSLSAVFAETDTLPEKNSDSTVLSHTSESE